MGIPWGLELLLCAVRTDFELSKDAPGIDVSFRFAEVVLVGCAWEWADGPLSEAAGIEAPGLRTDCDRTRPIVRGSDGLLIAAEGRINLDIEVSPRCSLRSGGMVSIWYMERGRGRGRSFALLCAVADVTSGSESTGSEGSVSS